MRRNNKQVTTYFILFGLLLIGVVYAILQANLQINGTAKIKANTWDIHFDNIQVNANSVSIGENDSQATIDPENNCKVDFEVTLSIPGDFYEFTIDVVNAGTIDGMIGTLNKTLKVNNEIVEETPDYLDYSVTYSDGVEIEENHKITAGTTETYLVRLEFKTDIEELPQAATITTSLEPQYLQADSSAVYRPQLLYNSFKTEAESANNLILEYVGEHKDSFTVPGTEKIYYWNGNKSSYVLEKWNVIFAGFCWQMWRTTDTGGVKLIYNGIPDEGKCIATGVDQQIGESPFNDDFNSSMSYAGYMYNPNIIIYTHNNSNYSINYLSGEDVTYENGMYTLVNTSTTLDYNHRYSCYNTTGICSSVTYYIKPNNTYYYVKLSDGRNMMQSIEDMLLADNVNQIDSTIKSYIDSWYQNNLVEYTGKLEDTIFCNNRSIADYGGWNPSIESTSGTLEFNNTSSNDLSCANLTDQFSVNNNKAHLTYPIGLMTASEANLLNSFSLRLTGESYYLLSPNCYEIYNTAMWEVFGRYGTVVSATASVSLGVRPAVSLKPGTLYTSGDGSKNNPYIVE